MRRLIGLCLLSSASASFFIPNAYAALPINPWYLSLNAGIFQSHFDLEYNDLSDVIPQNIRQPVQQYAYSGGIGIGYNRVCACQYLLGSELDVNFYTYHANFASGASTTAFSDQLAIDHNVDLIFIPGLFINESTAFYAKAGLSYAHVTSHLSSPAGFTSTYVRSSSAENVFGVALGLGIKRWISMNASIFAEYFYHDYKKINFSDFQNFSATYSHTVRLNTQNIAVGINYYL